MENDTTAYTVWDRLVYVDHTEVWSGESFAKALTVAVDRLGADDTVTPLDPTAVASLRLTGETPVQAWRVVGADNVARIIFITAARP
jgi:hypothetical protein